MATYSFEVEVDVYRDAGDLDIHSLGLVRNVGRAGSSILFLTRNLIQSDEDKLNVQPEWNAAEQFLLCDILGPNAREITEKLYNAGFFLISQRQNPWTILQQRLVEELHEEFNDAIAEDN